MPNPSKNSSPDSAGVQSRQDTSTTSVDYFFDQPNPNRRPANKTATNFVPVLATFDADNAVILANEVLLDAVERNRRTQQQLCDEDVDTLAHEFARVLQYRDIFEDHLTQSDRIEALRKRRSRIVLKSTMESYTNHKLFQERQAEEVVQRVRMEILSSFDRAHHGSGLTTNDITKRVEELAAVVVRGVKQDYISSARKEFARLRVHRDDEPHPTDAARYTTLSMRKLRWLFPVKQSATLADLVDEIISFRLNIVVLNYAKDSH